jgi:hypothetical protein
MNVTPDNKRFERDRKAARLRVGWGSAARLKWVVDFAQQLIFAQKKSSESQLARLRREIQLFISESFGRLMIVGLPEALGHDAVIGLRRTAHNVLLDWMGGKEFTLPASSLGNLKWIVQKEPGNWSGIAWVEALGRDVSGLFQWAFKEALAAEGGRIERCQGPGCQRFFVKIKRGAYCSMRCSQRTRTQRYRQRHAPVELSEKRHAGYVAKVARQKGEKFADKVRRNQPVPSGTREVD